MPLLMQPEAMDLGEQPLHALLESHTLANKDVVECDTSLAVTFKVIGKARKGRRLTARMQRKVLAAVNAAFVKRELPEVEFETIFNYVGP
jgi:hypothetical protein